MTPLRLNIQIIPGQSNWPVIARSVWEIDPAIAIHMMERFKSLVVHAEVQRLVRANPAVVMHTPEGLRYLIDDISRSNQRRELKVLPLFRANPDARLKMFGSTSYSGPRYRQ